MQHNNNNNNKRFISLRHRNMSESLQGRLLGTPEIRWWGAVANPMDLIWFEVSYLFLSRVSTLMRDIDIVILPVCPSVRPSVCTVAYNWQPSPKPHPHHTNTTLFEKSCGVGVVWVWFGRRLSVVCHRTNCCQQHLSLEAELVSVIVCARKLGMINNHICVNHCC